MSVRATAGHRPTEPARPSIILLGFLLAATAIVLGNTITGTGLTIVGAALAVAVIIMQRPDAATVLVLFAIYSNAAVVAVHFHNVPAVLAVVLPVALIAPLASQVLGGRQPIILTPTLPWMLAFLMAQILATAASANVDEAVAELPNVLVEGVGLFVLIVNVVRTPGMLRAACWAILGAGAILGTLSAYQELTGTYGNSYFGFAQVKDAAGGFFTGEETLTGRARQPELAGPIGDQNFYAQIMLMLIPVGMARTMAERRPWSIIAFALTALVAVGTVLTFSRGAALAALALVVIMVAIRFVRVRHLLVAFMVLAVMAVAVPEYVARVATLDVLTAFVSGDQVINEADVSLQSRATENLAAGLVFLDHPLFGVGPGQFPSYYQEYANRVGLEVQLADRQAHTLYLGIAAELGILGLVSFLGILAVTILGLYRVSRAVRRIDPGLAVTLIGLGLSLGAFMLTGLFLHLAYARYAWLVIALAAAGTAVARQIVREHGRGAPPREPSSAR